MQRTSNEVLALVRPHLEAIGFAVETGKGKEEKIDVPVLFGENNEVDKSFFADALSADGKIVIEVEAGRAVRNNQFLKDIFQACMMFEVEYLVIAVLKRIQVQFWWPPNHWSRLSGNQDVPRNPLCIE